MWQLPAMSDEARVSRPLRLLGSGAGLAQASHSAAGIWLTDGRDSRVISDDAISDLGTGHALRSAIAVVTNIVEDRALRPRLQEHGARIRFPGRSLQRSSGRHGAPPVRAAPAFAPSRSAAAAQKYGGRSRAPAPATG